MENEQIQNPAAERAAAIGEIILKAREVESRLHAAAGGEVVGIHALTELLGDKLPESLKRQLHFIAAIRNQAAHENEFQISEADMDAFRRAAEEAIQSLDRLFPLTGNVPPEKYAASERTTPIAVEVERDAFKRWSKKLHWMGFCPVIGVLNLLRLLLSCIYEQLGRAAILLFYLASIPMLIEGIRSYPQEQNLLYVGGGTAVVVYVLLIISAHLSKDVKLPKWLIYLPVVNVVFILVLMFKRMSWGKFLLAIVGLAAFVVMLYGVLDGNWQLAGYALLAEWFLSIMGSLCFPPEN